MHHCTIFFAYVGIISITSIYSSARRTPMRIPTYAIGTYNLVNAAVNFYVMMGLSEYVLNWHVGMHTMVDERFRSLIYIHFLCKYLDFTDTIVMILKHNWKQVHILQLYHHATIGVVWHWLYETGPMTTSTWGFGAFANALIHFLMYLHYFVSSLGVHNPFKNLLTGLQMLQFAICLVHAFVCITLIPELYYPSFVQVFYMSSMLALFYSHVYKKKDVVAPSKHRSVKDTLRIHINGRVYDASDFKHTHPGGNIIEQFDVSRVPDSTDAFRTFHGHSLSAEKVLRTLPVVDSIDAIPTDLHRMVDVWRRAGLFNRRLGSFAVWAGTVLGITLAGYALLSYGHPVWGGIVVGVGWAHCGFVQHHAGHLAVSGEPRYDFVIAAFFESVLKGGSNRWWRNRHNKHHAMPNSIDHDGDLRTTPFFAWDDILVKKVPTVLLRVQHLLFVPMLAMYVPVFFVTTKLFVFRRRNWDELGLIILHFYFSSAFFTNWVDFMTFYWIGYALQGVYLGIMFGVSHFSMPRVDNEATDWMEWQLHTTCNWGGKSLISAYVSGFLNVQIEHHIAPQMSVEMIQHIMDDVKTYAEAHHLPYTQLTFRQAFGKMIHGLKTTADKELARRRTKAE